MEFTDDDIRQAVEANVEDFYGNQEPDDIPQMAVEDAFDAYNIEPERVDRLWDEMIEVATAEYERMHEQDHKGGI